MNKINIALVGATGLVGTMFLKILEENNLNIGNIRLFASKKSKGKKIKFLNQYYEVEELDSSSFDNTDFIFFSAGKDVSSKYASIAEKKGIVIDNSSCFRQEKDIPLVVPEINFSDIDLTKRKLIANPNCSTIQCVMCLNVIKKLYHLNKIVYSTYQAVSGSGTKGIFDYQSSLEGYPKEFYPYDISKNCIPQIGDIKENNFTEEDAEKIHQALITLFEGDAAAMRPAGTMNVQKVYWWKHNCKTGQYPQIKVFKTLDIQPQKEYPFFTVTETPLPDLTPEVYTL